jgi:hypothetical protein
MKVAGLYPANLDPKSWKSLLTLIFPVVSMVLLLFVGFTNLMLYEDVVSSSTVIKTSYHIALGLGLVSVGIMMIHQWLKANSINLFLEKVRKIDFEVSSVQ